MIVLSTGGRMPLPNLVTAASRLARDVGDRVRSAAVPTVHRRTWVTNGRAHIEIHGVHRPGTEPAARELERRLADLPGVASAEVNAVLGRVVVTYDPAVIDIGGLRRCVDRLEGELGLRGLDAAPGSVAHPGNTGPGIREITALGISLLGLGYSIAGRALPIRALPPVLPTLSALVDSTPRLRSELADILGRPATDALFAVGNAVTHTLARQPVGLLAHGGYRYCLRREVTARQHAWQHWEQVAQNRPDGHRASPVDARQRPSRVPNGPVETIANASAGLALTGAAATFAATGNVSRAAGALQAGVPRAANFGRDAFAAQLDTAMSADGALVLDPDALRRLDRVDTVVIDAPALLTGRKVIVDLATLGDGVEAAELYENANDLIDLDDPAAWHRRDGWEAAALTDVIGRLSTQDRRSARHRSRRGGTTVVLSQHIRPVGLARVVPELDPLAEALVASAHQAGTAVLAGVGSRLDRRLRVDDVVAGGNRLAESVRRLQRAGHVVALVSTRNETALAAADVGIGLTRPGEQVLWGAHVVCGGVAQVCSLVDATLQARRASRYGAGLSVAGSALGGLLALSGPSTGAAQRAFVPVHGAALCALAAGTWAGMSAARQPPPIPRERTTWHAMSPRAVLRALHSSPDGLDDDEAARRLAEQPSDGDETQIGLGQAFVDELANPITPALAAGAGLSASLGSVTDPLLIIGVLALNALIGATQRLGSNRELRTLLDDHVLRAHVRRAGPPRRIRAGELVPGDVIELSAGDAVPADCRLLAATSLEIDEAGLTGESGLVAKSVRATTARNIADRTSMLYDGTVVAAGHAVCVVVATGPRTHLGRARLMDERSAPATGVEVRLQRLTNQVLPVCIAAGLGLMSADLLRGRGLSQALDRAVGLSVAAVPEGLPFVATAAELAAARRLSAEGVLARRPATIEALGRVDMLCFDKTGTLTEGRITLRRVSDGIADRDAGELDAALRDVVAVGLRASPWHEDDRPQPHPTDRAVLDGADRLGVRPGDGIGAVEWIAELRFEPSRGYHAVLGRCGDRQLVSVKGAPEAVLARCTRWRRPDGDVPFDQAALDRVGAEVDRLARNGFRVLAVAERSASGRTELDEARIAGLDFCGLLVLADPVRPTAAAAVDRLSRAGVEVIMITGDHPTTAEAIAAELDLLNGRRIVTGAELEEMDDEQLAADLPKIAVFARVSPAQKGRIVRHLRRNGRIVAMTGDGANDVPAIRLADVGIAVGTRSTPAAREAADLVITDDRIETITRGIVEGRAMWASVRDALSVLLGGNLGEIAHTVGAGLLSSGGGLNARQLLLVNLLTDVLPAMAIAVRPPPQVRAEDLLAEGPEASLGAVLNRDIYARAATTGTAATLAWLVARPVGTRAQSTTTGLVGLVGAQLAQTMAMRGRTPLVLAAGIGSLLVLGITVQTPGLSRFFGCRPLLPHQWAIGMGAATAATAGQVLLQPWIRRAPNGSRPDVADQAPDEPR